jgi:colanic acid biosynthesis glycosyl transferase WcaI
MKRAIFLNRYFSPDHSATSQILTDLAFHVAASGMETHVVTSQQLYDDPDARLSSQETVRDVLRASISSARAASARRRASASSLLANSVRC